MTQSIEPLDIETFRSLLKFQLYAVIFTKKFTPVHSHRRPNALDLMLFSYGTFFSCEFFASVGDPLVWAGCLLLPWLKKVAIYL